jgi:hypothetical protein
MSSEPNPPSRPATYDVAISFVGRDEGLARELYDRLDGLRVFFYPLLQARLAGTDGQESLREPFLSALLAVVLFRNSWGDTEWTRVEQQAIKDRRLERGWSGLMVVRLDSESTPPKWVPPTNLNYDLERFGVEQLVGAIKSRVVELGGEIRRSSPLEQARIVQREAELRADEAAWFRDTRWINESVHPAVEAIVSRIANSVAEIREQTGMPVEAVTAGQTADEVVKQFLELVARAGRGEVEFPGY